MASRQALMGLSYIANVYLLEEFISPVSNKRIDNYGGSIEEPMQVCNRSCNSCG